MGKRIRGRQFKKITWGSVELKRKENSEEIKKKATNLETPSGNSNKHWINLKSCINTREKEH